MLETAIAKIVGQTATVSSCDVIFEEGAATLIFSGGTNLSFTYWRLTDPRYSRISSFDHGVQYGLPAKIDAIERLRQSVEGEVITSFALMTSKADLRVVFGSEIELEIFGFTGYEIWTISFPDGTGQYSNYVLGEA